MAGLPRFSLEISEKFGRSLKKLGKADKSGNFVAIVSECLENLLINPSLPTSRDEPLPKKTRLP